MFACNNVYNIIEYSTVIILEEGYINCPKCESESE